MSIVIISGSPSERSRSARLLSYVNHLLQEVGQPVESIQVRLLDARHQLPGIFGADRQIDISDNGDFRLDSALQERLNDLAANVLTVVPPGTVLGPSATSEISRYMRDNNAIEEVTVSG